jgi:uncharacterized iron-regulated membrane protein
MTPSTSQDADSARLTHRTIWRWHFYAGLFCIPFVIWLAATGAIYLFKPQVEDWLDSPFDNLTLTATRAGGATHIESALRAVPGSVFLSYELPRTPHTSVRVIVGKGGEKYRVYVHPQTAAVLQTVEEDQRLMRQIFHLHGELNLGDKGSMAVELAASWAVIMVLSGLYLWWPRNGAGWAGSLYPRIGKGSRLFWRDLHAVTGLWVSFFTLFLLFTGLPWAKSWGGYLKAVRRVTNTVSGTQDWSTSRAAERAEQRRAQIEMQAAGEHAEHSGGRNASMVSFAAIDKMIATVAPLQLAHPVLIAPPRRAGGAWTAKSEAGNRTLRADLELDPDSGAIRKQTGFHQRHWVDRLVGIGIAAHEGQLFGLFNQLLGVFTALGLILICVSAVVLWWRRRPQGVLGAPRALAESGVSIWILAPVLLLAVYLPLLGATMLLVLVTERLVLRRIPYASHWLGLVAE